MRSPCEKLTFSHVFCDRDAEMPCFISFLGAGALGVFFICLRPPLFIQKPPLFFGAPGRLETWMHGTLAFSGPRASGDPGHQGTKISGIQGLGDLGPRGPWNQGPRGPSFIQVTLKRLTWAVRDLNSKQKNRISGSDFLWIFGGLAAWGGHWANARRFGTVSAAGAVASRGFWSLTHISKISK